MPRKKKAQPDSTPINSIKHRDKRSNIPTEELKGFMGDEDLVQKGMRYPRDSSLDPQLVWQGKDEQDGEDLVVPTVPIYVQEHIHPHALIEDFRREVGKGESEEQLGLFENAFDGDLDFSQKVDFYNHQSDWANRMILGDSLVVMNSLAEKEGLRGKVQCIYIDPPYGIKFGSNWQVSTRKRDVKDGKLEETSRQPEQVRAFRDTWEKGIHSYLSYLRDRLVVARDLLTESGSCFVQIGDENVHLIRCLMDEVFGSDNFIVSIILKKKSATTLKDPINDYILWFSKDRDTLKASQPFINRDKPESNSKFNTLISPDGTHYRTNKATNSEVDILLKEGCKWARVNYPLVSQDKSDRSKDFEWRGKKFRCGKNAHWRYNPIQDMPRLAKAGRIFDGGGKSLGGVVYWDDWTLVNRSNVWDDLHGEQEVLYVVQTNRKVLERCILMTTDPGDLVLDPTCGSGTTAYVAEQWGRRWITLDTSRVALALARTRLMSVKYPYYLLADSPEGQEKEADLTKQPIATTPTHNDIKKGFVYKTVPHITLKAIANNEEIDEIHDRWQQKLEPLRNQLNDTLGTTWEEWEIPRAPDEGWDKNVIKIHTKWWQHRRDRQKEIDDSIARRADQETLYDQPYEDKKRLRVTGPFTVESLSPHRVLDPDGDRPNSEKVGDRDAHDQFETRIIENLRKAGVQNTKQGERLTFDSLELYTAGKHIHGIGQYTQDDGTSKEVAVHIGSEYGTVSNRHIIEAAKEAIRGTGYDTLIICGFAFEPNVNEEAKNIGRLQVLITRMNSDLLLGDELLKKTKSANLFTVFGEPDLEISEAKGQLTITLNGLDIYDPTTGQIRSSTTQDIAAWFIDTNYNQESFFVRHAYFTGADNPYDKLKRTLKAEIDADAWEALYSTVSRPFPKPDTGKIAVKIINHYGDEVLKVFDL